VGTPTTNFRRAELRRRKESGNVKIDRGDYGASKNSLELKGRFQAAPAHCGFENPKDTRTRFALVALDLPAAVEKGSGKSD